MSSKGSGDKPDKEQKSQIENRECPISQPEMKKNKSSDVATKPQTREEAVNQKPSVEKEEPRPKPALKVREHWAQEKGQIVLTMYQKKLTKENVKVECTKDTISVLLSLPDGSKYSRHVQLVGEINTKELRWFVNPYKVQVFAPKKDRQKQWKTFELNDEEKALKKERSIFSSWSSEKEKAINEQYELAKKEEEEANALDSLFKKIYKDASDDTRRAMIKSYQTSGGTVLSTNWDEVKTKDYEGKDKVLPKGWEEDDA